MKTSYFYLLSFLIPINAFSQQAILTSGKGYQGYIFPDSHTAFVSIIDEKSRFTPSAQEIQGFEINLRRELSSLVKFFPDQGNKCPKIQKNLRNYIRQYFGFINDKDERILLVNFIWYSRKNPNVGRLTEDFIQVYGGCSKFWYLSYIIDSNHLYNLKINMRD